jgi:hypothetical protein
VVKANERYRTGVFNLSRMALLEREHTVFVGNAAFV